MPTHHPFTALQHSTWKKKKKQTNKQTNKQTKHLLQAQAKVVVGLVPS
jgi:hypothetical protein